MALRQPGGALPAPNRDRFYSQSALDLRKQIQQNFADRQEPKRILRSLRPMPPQPSGLPQPAPQAPSYDVLVLSAGGQFGAYGSGFLKGWGDRLDLLPNRAEIDMVTGVSTGAMMATHAYLGSSADAATRAQYDALLKTQYTTLRNEDVFRPRSPTHARAASTSTLWDQLATPRSPRTK